MFFMAMSAACMGQTDGAAGKKPRRTLREIRHAADSLRQEIRQSADRGEMLQRADSVLMARLERSNLSDGKKARIMRRYEKIRKRLPLYDRRLFWGDSILAAKYHRKNFDTIYISRPEARWTVKLRGNLSGAFMDAVSTVDGVERETKLMADFRGTLSVAASYRGLGLGISVNPAKWAGKSRDYEFNLNSYNNRYGFDVVYLSSKTYHGYSNTGGARIDIPKGIVTQNALNLNFYYAFNYRRFSFPAAFSQSYIQRRSAGSWMVGASFDGSRTQVNADEEHASFRIVSISVNEFAVGGGYAYNLVAGKHLLFHLSALPTFTVYSHDYTKTRETDSEGNAFIKRENMKYHFPSVIITGRGAALYSWRNKFAGVTMIYNVSVSGDREYLQMKREKWRLCAFFGFRF